MSILTDKKIIILGDRDGISAITIAECIPSEASAEVVYAATEFFATHMDLENQARIKQFTEKYGADKILLLLGTGEKQSTRLAVQTVTIGDPSGKGVLSGLALGVPYLHVLEASFREAIEEDAWDEHLKIYETALDIAVLHEEIRRCRA